VVLWHPVPGRHQLSLGFFHLDDWVVQSLAEMILSKRPWASPRLVTEPLSPWMGMQS
jgi:hypothetical protein